MLAGLLTDAGTPGMPVGAGHATSSGPAAFVEATSFPANWCERAGPEPDFRRSFFSEIRGAYSMAQGEACETRRLTLGFDFEQSLEWRNYLTDYTTAMAGCDLPADRNLPPGGIDRFGPGDTAAIGVESPLLGPDDVGLLIEQYVTPFAARLVLSNRERTLLEAHLWATAAAQISEQAANVLSVCDDAGPPKD